MVQFNVLKSSRFLPAPFLCVMEMDLNHTKIATTRHEKHHIQDNLGSRYEMMKDYLVPF